MATESQFYVHILVQSVARNHLHVLQTLWLATAHTTATVAHVVALVRMYRQNFKCLFLHLAVAVNHAHAT